MADAGEPVTPPWSGAVPAAGLPTVTRIPVPGPGNLAIEFWPRNFKGNSTSTLFIQDIAGKRVLRLDYGKNVKTKTIDYHWNQKGTFKDFAIADHTPVGPGGAFVYQASRVFRYGGRVLLVFGAVMDLVSIVQANNPLRRSTQVVSAWAMAWVGARSAGALGAGIGSAVEPGLGTAVGGLVFAIGGGIVGYWTGELAGAVVYDWAANTMFVRLPEIQPAFAGDGGSFGGGGASGSW
jgi:hypothetical protein